MKLPSTFVKKTNNINAVIETPKGCAAKYNFDKETQLFKLKKILPEGLAFPFHFGFIPFTLAEDGDPIDVLVLMNEPSWPGCIIECKVLGILEAEETQNKTTVKNNRIVAAAIESPVFKNNKNINSLSKDLTNGIINFFISYTRLEEKDFNITGKSGPSIALHVIKKSISKKGSSEESEQP